MEVARRAGKLGRPAAGAAQSHAAHAGVQRDADEGSRLRGGGGLLLGG